MQFELDDEQKLLRDTVREVLNRSYDNEKRKAAVERQAKNDRSLADDVEGAIGVIRLGRPGDLDVATLLPFVQHAREAVTAAQTADAPPATARAELLAGLRLLPLGQLFRGGRDVYPEMLTGWLGASQPRT